MNFKVENNIFELSSLKSYNKSYIKKTRRGKIRKVSNEIYVRDEILCGINFCNFCYRDYLGICNSKVRNIIFPNFDIFKNYYDFILQDESLNHVIIPYSILDYLNETDRVFINKLRNKLKNLNELPNFNESESPFKNITFDLNDNQYIRFPDTQFTETCLDNSMNKLNLEDCAGNSVIKVANWFIKHLSKLNTNVRFFILTENKDWAGKFTSYFSFSSKCFVVNPYEYINHVSDEYINAGEKLPFNKTLENSNQTENNYIFPEYASEKEINLGIEKGVLFKGILRMISRDRGEVETSNGDLQITINITGHINLNRSIDGDLVVVKLVETLNSDEESLKSHIRSELELDQLVDLESCEIAGMGSILLGDDDYDENKAMNIQSIHIKNSENFDDYSVNFTGKVVGILNRNWGEYCGSLIPMNSSDDRFNVCNNTSTRQNRIFVPIDTKIPKIIIHTKLSTTLENQRIVVVIDEWDCSSFYPTGHIVGVLGRVGDLETETSVILRIRDINSSEFSPSVLKCLPNHGRSDDWKPNEVDMKDRVDLRNKLVFSVDPPGCKDIDDALSIELIKPKGENYEENWYLVSVHIADVTHFVKPNTPIDDEASRRSTTCYLVNKRIDMLPEELTTNICSLVSNKDRLSFTCNWEINENAEVRSIYFNKTIINSKYSFTYLQAQNIIDDKCDNSEVAVSLRRLMKISKILRENRIRRGAIELASSEVKVDYEESRNKYQDLNSLKDLDKEHISSAAMNIKSVSTYNYLNTNLMVEEFMLLANVSVAKQIISKFPNCSLLRRHPEPKYDQLEKLKHVLSKVGITNFVYENSLSLSNSLKSILDSEIVKKNPIIGKLVRILTTRTMNQALYFTTCKPVDGTFHYGLAEELYTHFTSPIRRYADIVVHRLLSASIGLEPLDEIMFNKDYMFKLSNTLNKNKRNAQMAGRDSSRLFIYLFCKQNGKQESEGVIIQVRDDSLLIFVPNFGFEGLAPIDKNKYVFDANIPCLKNREKETDTLKLFDKVKVTIFASDEYFQNKVMINMITDSS